MEPSYTLTMVLLVDHQFQALSRRFPVRTTPNDELSDLKEKVKELIPHFLSRFAIECRRARCVEADGRNGHQQIYFRTHGGHT
jgi:hypothetical protein